MYQWYNACMRRQVTLPDELWRQVRLAAVAEGTSASEIVNAAVTIWLTKYAGDPFGIFPPVNTNTVTVLPEPVIANMTRFGSSQPAPKPMKKSR